MDTAAIIAAIDYADASTLIAGAVVALVGVYVLKKAAGVFLGFLNR